MRFLRRIFYRDERVAESLIKKVASCITENTYGGTASFTFDVDDFSIYISKRATFDVTSGASGYQYQLKIDGIVMKASSYSLSRIFSNIYKTYNKETTMKLAIVEEENDMLYRDIKNHFNV